MNRYNAAMAAHSAAAQERASRLCVAVAVEAGGGTSLVARLQNIKVTPHCNTLNHYVLCFQKSLPCVGVTRGGCDG